MVVTLLDFRPLARSQCERMQEPQGRSIEAQQVIRPSNPTPPPAQALLLCVVKEVAVHVGLEKCCVQTEVMPLMRLGPRNESLFGRYAVLLLSHRRIKAT